MMGRCSATKTNVKINWPSQACQICVNSVPSKQMTEDCEGDGDKQEETERIDVADKDAGGKTEKSK